MNDALVIVTGAGRSGTSAVARLLHEAGITMGSHLLGATESNPTGYYEERAVAALNDRILAACGLDRWFGEATRAEMLAAAEAHGDEMARLAAAAGGGWKDPRFCWTLEAWLPHLRSAPRVVVCLRNPIAAVESTLRRYGQVGDEARRWVASHWSRQYERLLEVLDDHALAACCVDYDELAERPEAAVERLAAFVGRPLDPALIDASLRRERPTPVPPEFSVLYERVRALAGSRARPRQSPSVLGYRFAE